MRKFLAIVVCKLGRFVGKLVGKGSSMPGKFALKICPDILKRVQLPPHIIAVTGSNGKTSTVEMIATVLRAQGKHVIYNAEGSNQVEGVTTLILTHATLGGKVNADVLLLESDERYAAHSFKYFHPTEFVITNLYRDQLTRNGHPESVFDAILPALHLIGALGIIDDVPALRPQHSGDHLHSGGLAVGAGDSDDVGRQRHPFQNIRAYLQGKFAGHGTALADELSHKAAQLADHNG